MISKRITNDIIKKNMNQESKLNENQTDFIEAIEFVATQSINFEAFGIRSLMRLKNNGKKESENGIIFKQFDTPFKTHLGSSISSSLMSTNSSSSTVTKSTIP